MLQAVVTALGIDVGCESACDVASDRGVRNVDANLVHEAKHTSRCSCLFVCKFPVHNSKAPVPSGQRMRTLTAFAQNKQLEPK